MSQPSQHVSNQLLHQMIRKENTYKAGIRENHDLACTLAQRLSKGGQLESLLKENIGEYREKLKELSEKNVLHERKVNAFVGGLNRISSQSEEIEDYSSLLKESIDAEMKQLQRNSIEIHQEKMYLDTCLKLGEISAANQDDELEVMEAVSTVSLKCPITAMLLQEPVRNKVCHHVYSKHAIQQYLQRNRKCPCVGCGNTNVTLSQLEDDMATARLVRREQIKLQQQQKQMSQNATDLADDDDDDEA
eukprot:scaffold22589_cov138-Cylindrotheca_fusiformis.AAC.55